VGTLTQTQKKALALKVQRLGERVDIKRVDGVLDEILKQIVNLKCVTCMLADDSSLCLQAGDETVATVKMDRAKSVLRMMCARLSVLCSKWAKREVSPYGDHVELVLPLSKLSCKVDFQNTPDVQRIGIQVNQEAQIEGDIVGNIDNAPLIHRSTH
jgi:hypothetical protein